MPTLQGLLGYLTEGGAPVRNALKGLLSGDLTPLQNAGSELSALVNPTMQQKQKLAGILAGNGQSSLGYDDVMNNPGVQAAMNFAPMGVGMIKTEFGKKVSNFFSFIAFSFGQPRVDIGQRPDENQVSRTSGSW